MNDAQTTTVAFTVKLNLLDLPELRLMGTGLGLIPEGESLSTEEALYAVTVCPQAAPLDIGFELLQGSNVTSLATTDQYLLTVKAQVHDEEAVMAAAIEAYQCAWQDPSWEPSSLAEALYELVLASNENPNPTDLGFEIISWSTSVQELCNEDEMVA